MMRKGEYGQSVRILTRGLFLAATVAATLGCSAEQFAGGLDASPGGTGGGGLGAGSGGASVGTGGDGTGGDGTGGDGSGGMGTGGDGSGGMGTGGDATGGSGGGPLDSAPDLAPKPDVADVRDTGPEGNRDAADGATDGAACVNGITDLSNVGTGDFRISFRVETTQTGSVALVNQRSICNFVVFWDIRQSVDGLVNVETSNLASSYQVVRSTAKINDGTLHDIEVTRVSGTLTIRVDGAVSGIGPSSASLGALAPLRIGSDVCGPSSNPPTAAFAGKTLSDVCITK